MIGAELFQVFADFLKAAWGYVWPFFVVDQWDEAIVLRLGKYHRTVQPGYHWKWPLLEQTFEERITTSTIPSASQSLTTKDGQNIVVSGIIKYRVTDMKVFLTETEEPIDAIGDLTQGIIKNVVMCRTWEECRNPNLDHEITKKVRVEAKRWGIEVEAVTLGSLAILRSFRLIR